MKGWGELVTWDGARAQRRRWAGCVTWTGGNRLSSVDCRKQKHTPSRAGGHLGRRGPPRAPPLTASSACLLYAFTLACSLSTRSWSLRMFLRSSSACEQSVLPGPATAVSHLSTHPDSSLYLVSHLLDFSLVFVCPLQSFGSPLLLSIQLVFQLPHLGKRARIQARPPGSLMDPVPVLQGDLRVSLEDQKPRVFARPPLLHAADFVQMRMRHLLWAGAALGAHSSAAGSGFARKPLPLAPRSLARAVPQPDLPRRPRGRLHGCSRWPGS